MHTHILHTLYMVRTCTHAHIHTICTHKINRKWVLYSRHQSMYVSQSISNFPSFEMKSLWWAENGKKIWITYWSAIVISHLQIFVVVAFVVVENLKSWFPFSTLLSKCKRTEIQINSKSFVLFKLYQLIFHEIQNEELMTWVNLDECENLHIFFPLKLWLSSHDGLDLFLLIFTKSFDKIRKWFSNRISDSIELRMWNYIHCNWCHLYWRYTMYIYDDRQQKTRHHFHLLVLGSASIFMLPLSHSYSCSHLLSISIHSFFRFHFICILRSFHSELEYEAYVEYRRFYVVKMPCYIHHFQWCLVCMYRNKCVVYLSMCVYVCMWTC